MSSERLWILILAATCFCAGLAAGVLFGVERFPQAPQGTFAEYEARLTEAFDLDPQRRRHLREVLKLYDEELERLKERNVLELERELADEGQKSHERIRLYVIPEHRRQQFDRWSVGFRAETRPE